MMRFVIVALFILPGCVDRADLHTYDVCVYGGSEAGFSAAAQASRMGCRVVLIEPTGHPGGMLVEGIAKDIRFGSSVVIGGIAREMYTAIEARYGRTANVNSADWRPRYEPSVAEAAVEDLLAGEVRIDMIRGRRIREGDGVIRNGNRISQVVLEDGSEIWARVFVDASIEGHLLHMAGVTTEWIREGNEKYGETKNGIQTDNSYRQFAVPVDPYNTPGDPQSGLIPTIQQGQLGRFGAPDKHIQGYCFRLCLTRDPVNCLPISKPVDYHPHTYEIYRRYLAAGGRLFRPVASRPNGKTDLGSWHDLSANLYGENWMYPAGSYSVQDSVVRYHEQFTRGLIWFLQNDEAVDEHTRKDWIGWGLCRDEFVDNGGWPRRLYIRSARRMVSDYVITQHHTSRDNPVRVPDPVAIAWWPPDTHHARRIVQTGVAYNEGFVFGGDDWRPFGVSWRALVPRRGQCVNLISPTCLSSSYVAYGAIRIVPTFIALGQAAGAMAALATRMEVDVQKVPYADTRRTLLNSGQILTMPENWLEIITTYD